MCYTVYFLTLSIILLNIEKNNATQPSNVSSGTARYTVQKDEDGSKSSLVFVFDTTGSMYNDLRQLREGAEMILNTALEESDVIGDFVFVPFHDPVVGPATVTRSKQVFKSALNIVRVYGGGDCPEKSLGGIHLALNVSRPRSFVYVFTDATAADHRLVGKVLDAVQRKQSQVVFVLTGHCNDLHKPSYQVYHQIAAASSGQVFNLNKTSVHKVLDFVKSSIKGRSVNLGSVLQPAGQNFTQEIPVDSTLSEVTVSVSGAKPQIKVVNPSGEELHGPPKLVTTLDLAEIMVVKVLEPEPGNWTITVGSEEDYSVKVVGLSNLTFNHGFSVERPTSVEETSYRPLKGTYNHMLISLTQTDAPVHVNYAEIVSLSGNTLFEVALREFQPENKIYIADAFVPPDDFFYIAIKGWDQYNQELRRIGATAVQAKTPDVPYITVPRAVEARPHERVILKCSVESLVPVTAVWTKDGTKVQSPVSSLQSTTVEYVIEDMSEQQVGTYRCVGINVAGTNRAATALRLIVDPPQVTIQPDNTTLAIGGDITISCTVYTEALLDKLRLVYNGTGHKYYEFGIEPTIDGVYTFNKTIHSMDKTKEGIYSCVASNRGGKSTQSTYIQVEADPIAQILGPHTITKPINTDIQIVCTVDNAHMMQWVAPNHTVVSDMGVDGNYIAVLDVKNITDEGTWKCVALRGARRASDGVELIITMKPAVTITGPRNLTIVDGSSVELTCVVVAKPPPRIVWHKETEVFLNHTVSLVGPNTYNSVLTLNSSQEAIPGMYFCYGENAEGIAYDNATVSVRRNMTLVQGFDDNTVELYSKVDLHCIVDTYPPARITWRHNGTALHTNNNKLITENKATLSILRVNFEDLGEYSCEADNGYEKMYVNGTLSVSDLESPVISGETDRVIARNGQSTLITCRVIQGNPAPTTTWKFKSYTSINFADLPRNVRITDSGDRHELYISDITIDNSGTYRCIAENVVGRDDFDTTLAVQYPPQIISASQSATDNQPMEVEVGGTVKLSCESRGNPPPIVVWSKDRRPLVYKSGVYLTDTNELVIEDATPYDSGVYSCNVSSSIGSTQRNFTLVVYEPSKIITPEDSVFELETLEGQLVELPCTARGVPTPRVVWLQNGVTVTEGRKYIDENGIRFVANLTDFGEYTCVANNSYGSTNISYSVYVWVPPSVEPPLEVKKDVLIGSNVSLDCNVVGFPIPTIIWELKNEILTENTTSLSFNDVGNLYISNISSNDQGVYVCVAENVAGVAKKMFQLIVIEPPKLLSNDYQGPYIATNMDTSLMITCGVAGKPKPYVLWIKDNYYLDKDSRYDIDRDGTLTIRTPSVDLSGEYMCIAKNSAGEVNRTVVVEIYSLPSRMQSEQSQSTLTAVEGSDVTADCPVHATRYDKVKWYKDAKLVSTGRLLIPSISRNEAGTYACVVSNTVGSAHSTVALRVVWPPTFREEAKRDVRVAKGDDWYFDCESDANPSAKTKWQFNWRPVLFEDKPRLRILDARQHHAGSYECVVSNDHGTITRQYTLHVLEPPFISEFDLLDVQLRDGANASLSCDARGSPAPNVTWSFNNTHWHVYNTTLVTSNISDESEGLYRCDATNEAGAAHIVYRVSVVTPAAVQELVVYRDGVGATVLQRVEAVVGSRVRISCNAKGNPTPKIQWIKNGNTLSENDQGIAYADLVLENVDTSHAGFYICVVTNEGGVDERRIKMEILESPKIFQTLFQNTNHTDSIINLEIISGQAFFLHCHPYGNPMPEVYWFKDDQPLRLFDDTMVSTDFGEVIVSKNALYEQSGNYSCVARNKVGNASVVYLVDVLVPPPKPKETSKVVTAKVGKLLNLTCPVEGSPVPYVMWVKHPYTEIGENTTRLALLRDNFTLIINGTEVSDSGNYSCIMTNKVGTTEVVFDVIVEKPPSIGGNVGKRNVESHVVHLRRSIVLKCEADGYPLPRITWLKDTQQLSNSISNIQSVLGNSLLAIWSADVRDAGQYICVVENSAGTAHRRYNVAVQVPGKWSPWSQWSYCNVTCGLGYQQRTRVCQYVDDNNVTIDKTTKPDRIILDESSCKGFSTDRRKCHMPPCEEEWAGRWSAWSRWSACSATCGAGTQARSRRCRHRGGCGGDNVQIRKCPDLHKCSSSSQDPAENDVYSREEATPMSPHVPEETYEFQPEVVNSKYDDVDEFRINTYRERNSDLPPPPPQVYPVKVTENLDRSDRGPCDPGYRHNGSSNTCEDIDECVLESNVCHATQVCANSAGAYSCGCERGYRAPAAGARCLDINECVQRVDGYEFACVNVAGGYVCACPAHLRLHVDRRHCVPPALYREPLPFDQGEHEEYLSTAIDYPARYTKYPRN